MLANLLKNRRAFAGVWFALLLFPLVSVAAPRIEHWTTPQGVPVYFVRSDSLPMVDVRLLFDAGSARDGATPGLAQLTGSLLSEGADGQSAETLARGFEDVGAQFSAGVSQDSAYLSLRSLSDKARLASALDGLARILRAPDFPEDAFVRERDRQLLAIRARAQSPGEVADEAFMSALFGTHPYAHPVDGNAVSVGALTRDQVRAFHQRHYTTGTALIALVGALDRVQAEALAERLAGSLPKGEALPALPPVLPLDTSRRIDVPFPAQQASILIGQPGIARLDPDYFPLYVGNHILGGSGFSSRLVSTIREERGLAYSVYSYFMPMRQAGPFQMGMQTKLAQGEMAIGLLEADLKRFIAEGPSEEELAHARKNILGGFALRLDSNRKLVENIAAIGYLGLPLDYLDRYRDRVAAVTREDIKRAFAKHLRPETMVTVVVGGLQATEQGDAQGKQP